MLTYDQLSALLNVPKSTLYGWVQAKKIPFVRLGPRTVRFHREAILAWAETLQGGPAPRGDK